MPMFCNAMLLLLYVHVCVTRTGWKTRPRPKTVILLIKQSINHTVNNKNALKLHPHKHGTKCSLTEASLKFATAEISPV